jgi:hypothetical protein
MIVGEVKKVPRQEILIFLDEMEINTLHAHHLTSRQISSNITS